MCQIVLLLTRSNLTVTYSRSPPPFGGCTLVTPCNWTDCVQFTLTHQKLKRQQIDAALTGFWIWKAHWWPKSKWHMKVYHHNFLLPTPPEGVMKAMGTGFDSITWHHLPIRSLQYLLQLQAGRSYNTTIINLAIPQMKKGKCGCGWVGLLFISYYWRVQHKPRAIWFLVVSKLLRCSFPQRTYEFHHEMGPLPSSLFMIICLCIFKDVKNKSSCPNNITQT